MGGEPNCAEPLELHDKYHYLYNQHNELNPRYYRHFVLISSSQVQLLFRTLANTSHQRTGLVYSPLRGDVATYQPKLIAEERGDSTRYGSLFQVFQTELF